MKKGLMRKRDADGRIGLDRHTYKYHSKLSHATREAGMNGIGIETLREKQEILVGTELQKPGARQFWEMPIMASAPVDDRFATLPEIAMDEHLVPGSPDGSPSAN